MGATTRVYLVRHGKVENPRKIVYGRLAGWTLSEEGRRQAHDAAQRLAAEGVSAVYTSPLERAVQTAELIARACGAPLRIREDLTEAALCARWEGLLWRDVRLKRTREWLTYLRRPLEMRDVPETLSALAQRMEAGVRALADAHPGERIVAVSHGDPIRAAVLALTGRDLGGLHGLRVPTGWIVTLDVRPEGAELVEHGVP
ncbi:MAG TPA: histidine phosphatase family protein [Vicinamibacteria bacterium]|jgi:probable phosphoglycerate mutase